MVWDSVETFMPGNYWKKVTFSKSHLADVQSISFVHAWVGCRCLLSFVVAIIEQSRMHLKLESVLTL